MMEEMELKKQAAASLQEEIKKYEGEFISLIHRRLGIMVHHQIREMYKAIADACLKFHCQPAAYLTELNHCPEDSPWLEHLILRITIGETYFFRDKNQMKMLQETILPGIIKNKRENNNLSLRIWSAGCSSGEELYTIIMMLYHLLPDLSKWTLNLIGTDINTKQLQKAISGNYTEWSMRSIADYYKQRYFTYQKNEYLLAPDIKTLANFFYLNLNEDNYPSIFNGTNSQDLIVCRNVLIYFNADSILHIMKKMNASLMPGGYLLLGASDPINQAEIKNMYSYSHGALLKSRCEESPKHETKPSFTSNIAAPPKVLPPMLKKKYTPTAHIDFKVAKPEKYNLRELQQKATKLMAEFHWKEVLELINHHEQCAGQITNELLNIQALAYANLGQLKQALQSCTQSLALNPTDKFSYITYSLILTELNKLVESETALRNALFLDHQFVIGHFQLGLLLLRKKLIAQGLKCLRNALTIASKEDERKLVPGCQDMSYGHFTEILKHEIAVHESENQSNANNL